MMDSIQKNKNLFVLQTSHNMLKSILPVFLVGVLLLHGSLSLRTYEQTAPNIYDADQYKVKLQIIQDNYRKQAETLNQQLDYINDLIADKSITKRQKIVKLSQSMADQREMLYRIQKTAQLPYEIKQCECIEISEEDKQKIIEKINSINETINKLESSYVECSGDTCAKTQEMKDSTDGMKGYLQALRNIVDSDCCKKPLYIAPEKATGLVDLNQTLVIDNLEKLWNYVGHTRLADNQYFIEVTSKNEYRPFRFQITTKFNTSNCPASSPLANFENNTCFRCNLTCLKFDLVNRTCYDCNQSLIAEQCLYQKGQFYDKQSNSCKRCPQNQEYSPYYHKCQQCQGNQYIGASFKCEDCPKGLFYDRVHKNCSSCPGLRYFSTQDNKCVRCPQNTELDSKTMSCQPCKEQQFYNVTTGLCSGCQEGLIYNATEKKCMKIQKHCPIQSPFYNQITGNCEACHKGTVYIFQINRCVRTNKIGICSPKQPHYNYFTHQCEACKDNQVYNPFFKDCQAAQDSTQVSEA